MDIPGPTTEHEWLSRLAGEWSYDTEAMLGPDAPPWKSSGSQSVRMLGAFWAIAEIHGETPHGVPSTSILTMGYDPVEKKFAGSFIASVMTHFWVYEGRRDGDVLTLEAEGPGAEGATARYRSLIEIVGEDEYTLSSEIEMAGAWVRFTNMVCRRAK